MQLVKNHFSGETFPSSVSRKPPHLFLIPSLCLTNNRASCKAEIWQLWSSDMFLGVCLESTSWCLIYWSSFFLLFLLFYTCCAISVSSTLLCFLSVSYCQLPFLILSVERQAWKSVSPSRPLKPIISRIVSFHSIFKFELIRVQYLLLPLFFTKYKLSMSGLVFETILLILWNNTHSVAGLRLELE